MPRAQIKLANVEYFYGFIVFRAATPRQQKTYARLGAAS